MEPPHPLIAVDWGTTNRRLFVIDEAGHCTAEECDEAGVATLGKAEIFPAVTALQARFRGHRLLLAGMIGSSIGWHEVPYVPCPAGLGCLLEGAASPHEGGAIIVPGVRSAPEDMPDVMRGEEVQLIGAAEAGLIPPDCPVCHPGTHAKWAQMRGYAIQRFRTVMTGELFALLRSSSILAPALTGEVRLSANFLAGLEQGLASRALAADLFSIRARLLLGELDAEDAASWASGVLIGADVRFGLEELGGGAPVAVIGDPQLTALYATGLLAAGRDCFEVDGAAAFIAGAHALSRRLPCPK